MQKRKKGLMLVEALATLILALVVAIFLFDKIGVFIKSSASPGEDELGDFDTKLQEVIKNSEQKTMPMFLNLFEEESLFFLINKDYEELTVTADGENYVVARSELSGFCVQGMNCICYCDKYTEEDGKIMCKKRRLTCENYNVGFDIKNEGEEFFFVNDGSGIVFEGGFALSKEMLDISFGRGVDILIEKTPLGIKICETSGERLCSGEINTVLEN